MARLVAPQQTNRGSGEWRPLLPLLLGAAALALVLVVLLAWAMRTGYVPKRVAAAMQGADVLPTTTNPLTTATGSLPIESSTCGRVPQSPGAACDFRFSDQRGHLVQRSLSVPVPLAWLEAHGGGAGTDSLPTVAALIDSPYAPSGDGGLETLALSVSPSYAHLLAQVGVGPGQLLAWLYQNVPTVHRPPWVPGASLAGTT